MRVIYKNGNELPYAIGDIFSTHTFKELEDAIGVGGGLIPVPRDVARHRVGVLSPPIGGATPKFLGGPNLRPTVHDCVIFDHKTISK